MQIDVRRIEGEPVSIQLNGQEFACEEEGGDTIVPREFLTGFRLSEIPDGVTIKPVEHIEDGVIHVNNHIGLTRFADGSASAFIEEVFRRKFWDGEVGLSPYVVALRQAIAEINNTQECDFQDDGDYIFLHYEITILDDLDIRDAIHQLEIAVTSIHERTDQLTRRRRDPLLGIFDRGSFDGDLAHHLLHANKSVGLLMADIDHFKPVNDQYGHQAGDAVLRQVAQTLSAKCGGTAEAYRYGGEELAIISPGADRPTACHLAELVRSDVEALTFSNTPTLKVTISVGLAIAPDDAVGAEELVGKADEALYKAKHEGRNCVRTAS